MAVGGINPNHIPGNILQPTAAPEKKNNNPVGSDNPLKSSTEKQEALKDINSEESKKIRLLETRDREVRAHEQAHLAAAGRYAKSGANYTYEKGPDGINYAVGGDVKIDTAPIPNDPEATIQKAETIRRAALAPKQPSGQDHSVAAHASHLAAEARIELQQIRAEARKEVAVEFTDDRSRTENSDLDLQSRLRQSGAIPDEEAVHQFDELV